MHGGKADIGNLIEFPESPHDICADGGAGDFLLIGTPLLFQFIQEIANLVLGNGPLCAREPNSTFQFRAAVRFPRTVALHNDK